MLVSITIVTIIAAITLPTFYALRDGYTSSGADTIVSAALSSAKAMAAREQKYAGIRFQCVPDPENPSLPGDQYLIFIIEDSSLSPYGFRAAKGVAPIKLPVNQAVTDMFVKVNYSAANPVDLKIGDSPNGNDDITTTEQLWDATTFSIVFSPSGRLVAHDVCVWNMEGKTNDTGVDMVFNTFDNVSGAIKCTPPMPLNQTWKGIFYQDKEKIMPDGWQPFPQEPSRKNLVVYDRRAMKKTPANARWSGYLKDLATGDNSQTLYINPYTGTIIENQSRKNATR
jgi:hypothetical protein